MYLLQWIKLGSKAIISLIQAIKNSKMQVVEIGKGSPLEMADVDVTKVGLTRLIDF